MALELKPAARGEKLNGLNQLTGAKEVWTVMDVKNGLIKLKSDSGSTVTKSETWFAPALEWDDEGEKGTSVVDWEAGSLWPLKAGNKAYFHRLVNRPDGSQKEENWRCTVEGPSKAKLADGTSQSAYKVTCVSETNVHTWYWGAEEGVGPLQYVRSLPGAASRAPGLQEVHVRAANRR